MGISTVTLWYFISPYLVRTHPKFAEDIQQLVSNKSKASGVEEWVENWTKWQVYLGQGEKRITIYPHTQTSLAHMRFPLKGELEWREEYKFEIRKTVEGQLEVVTDHPWYGETENIPTIGMMTGSPGSDRVLVQCFMNLVIL